MRMGCTKNSVRNVLTNLTSLYSLLIAAVVGGWYLGYWLPSALFSVSAGLVGFIALAFGSHAFYRHYAMKYPTSPIILFASYDSGVGGTMLVFRADGTFRYIATDVVTGHYTRTNGLIRLDQLPKTGLLKRQTLLVRPSPFTETSHGIWQVGLTGRVDSTLVVFTIFPAK